MAQRHEAGLWRTAILAGNHRFPQPLEVYGLRWEIENLFQCLKGRGFHREETRLTRYFRIKKVMALLALAFCWAHKTGEWKHQAVRPLKTKKHGRPGQSLFRYGLDYLINSLLQGLRKMEEVQAVAAVFMPAGNGHGQRAESRNRGSQNMRESRDFKFLSCTE